MKKLLLLATLLLSLGFAKSQTNVSGGIFSNTTWTLAGSPYTVTANVVVFPGVTLTIQPGVVVKFDNGTDLEIRQAQLNASGTAVDSIIFTSNAGTPHVGIYGGVWLNGGSMSSHFAYCRFTYADSGICTTTSDSLVVSNSLFNVNMYGILGSSGGVVAVNNSNFVADSMLGVSLYSMSGGTYFKNSAFLYNTTGLNVGYAHSLVSNCIFKHNRTGVTGSYIRFVNNQVSQNKIGIDSYSENVYQNSVIDSNTVEGISANGDSVLNCKVNYNATGIKTAVSVIMGDSIEYNIKSGIYDNSGWNGSVVMGNDIEHSAVGIDSVTESFNITQNTISNNGYGIILANSTSTISCNTICNSTTYGLMYKAAPNISVANNYWCTHDSASTQPLIYDAHQNVTYGLVNFMPLDTVPCVNPCSLSISASASTNPVCIGNTTVLTAHVTDAYSYTVKWMPGSYTGINYTVTPTGNPTYTLVVTDIHGCTDSTTIKIFDTTCSHNTCTLSVYATASMDSIPNCGSTTLYANIIDSTSHVTSITWQPGSYTGSPVTVTPATTTMYTVTVTDSAGCTATGYVLIMVGGSLATPSICYVTSDTASNHNMVVWSKVGWDTLAIDSVIIYREFSLNNYLRIGATSVHGYTEFEDLTSHPNTQSYYYEIAVQDTCSGSSLSSPEETILLQSGRGFGSSVNLIWNLYWGNVVNYYRIMRDDSGTGNWHVIDSVPGNVGAYTDINAPSSPNLRYMLSTVWYLYCSPYLPPIMKHNTGGNDNASGNADARFRFNTHGVAYSNITNVAPNGINEIISSSDVDIYPNPASSQVFITMHQTIDGSVTISDVLGQSVYHGVLSPANGATQSINISSLTPGVYFLKIEANSGQVITKKLIKN